MSLVSLAHMPRLIWALLATVQFLACGCGNDASAPDDATVIDSGVPFDVGADDDGLTSVDAGALDADAPDAAPDATPSPFVLYVDADGDDGNDGSTPALAVKTLARVQQILEAVQPSRDVEVRINQGTYVGQSVAWTYYHPAHAIRFMPIDYTGGGIDSIAGRPLFDGAGAPSLLRLQVSSGEQTHLELIYLEIARYRQYGVLFQGNRNDFAGGWNGGNRVFGCYFRDIGNLASAGDGGYAGLDLVNTRENEIRNNHFVRLENQSAEAGLMHGVYLAHGSSGNQIRDNRFQEISGDPIRARDYSNANDVRDNRFIDTGVRAFYSDWWCDMSVNPNCTKPSGECPSWENEFRDNELHCGYDGEALATFEYIQGVDYVPDWCTDHADTGWARLYTSGNTKSCP